MASNYFNDEEEDDFQNLVTCDNCLEYEGYILNPKTLPCQHVLCIPCLDGQRRNSEKILCAHKDCLQEHDADIDELPSALGDLKICCDTCALMNGERFMTASVYCVQCDMKYCNDHHKAHNLLNKHRVMSIKDYLQSWFAHELRYCVQHQQEVYSLGCPDCSQLFCAECVDSIDDCRDGIPHKPKLVSLKKLSEFIKDNMESLKIQVEDKYAKIAAVVNDITIALYEWDIETDEGVRLIHRTRDEQLGEVRDSYTTLEKDYIRSRKSNKEKITEYLSEKAAVIQSGYLKQLQKLRKKQSYRHPVDLVKEREEIQRKVDKLKSEHFPKLLLQNQVKPMRKDEKIREIEIELPSTDDVIIGGLVTPPTGLQLARQITVGSVCYTVCQYNGYTYAGLWEGGIDRIDDQGKVTSKFIESAVSVGSVRVHNDKLYILICSKPHKLCVHDLTGQLITSWEHHDYECAFGQCFISVINDQLAVVCSGCQQVTLYTLNGDIVTQIPSSLISKNNDVSICGADDDSVVITDHYSSKVFRQNLTSGEIEWVSTSVDGPLGVVCYGGEYVLVTSEGKQTKVWILDLIHGKLVGELTDQTIREKVTHMYDLYIEGDTLIVPRCRENAVLYYILQTADCRLKASQE